MERPTRTRVSDIYVYSDMQDKYIDQQNSYIKFLRSLALLSPEGTALLHPKADAGVEL